MLKENRVVSLGYEGVFSFYLQVLFICMQFMEGGLKLLNSGLKGVVVFGIEFDGDGMFLVVICVVKRLVWGRDVFFQRLSFGLDLFDFF